MLYSVALVSAIQHCESVIIILIYLYPLPLEPPPPPAPLLFEDGLRDRTSSVAEYGRVKH